MHIITKRPLTEFWISHPDAETPLKTWLSIMGRENFSDLVNLRATFGRADDVDGLTVFNIGGNKYRLIASIHYNIFINDTAATQTYTASVMERTAPRLIRVFAPRA